MVSLETLIGYDFQNKATLHEALTHPSLSYETQQRTPDNQRLEFLGDAVLQLIVTEELYCRFGKMSEGPLTKLRSSLVSRSAIARYAHRLGLGELLRMGKGEETSGGRHRPSSLADAFEAVVGAIFVDGGFEKVKQVVIRLLTTELNNVHTVADEFNPKGILQELLQAKAPEAPTYEIVREEGPDHAKLFVARVMWQGHNLGEGTGASKKQAEAEAARNALLNQNSGV